MSEAIAWRVQMNRSERRRLGLETVAILERGGYAIDDTFVDLRDRLERAVEATVEYPVGEAPPRPDPGVHATHVEVRNTTTLAAAAGLVALGHDVAALNFASAKSPGGGFLNGSIAQEESLAMSSGLYACLVGRRMYEHHRALRDPLYTSWAIHSPGVPVIRDEQGALVREPYDLAFVTAPAPNTGVVLTRDPTRAGAVTRALEERIDKVLCVAAHHGHDALVLGAWGCGVFKNDPHEVASLFASALHGPFAGVFARVIFAVLDTSTERRFIGPFESRFNP